MYKVFLCIFSFSVLFADRADDVLKDMSFEEKIGQFFIIPICPNDQEHIQDVIKLMKQVPIGGILLKSGTVGQQASVINQLQALSKIPLVCCLDAENGIGRRLTDAMTFPNQLTLGAIQEDNILFDLGREIGRQCREVGGHINFAPIVDVNTNPSNPIIHERAFGDNPENVIRKAKLLIAGMLAEGILPCLKHFPGHGDVREDSHLDLPRSSKSKEEIAAVELKPFKELIDFGVPLVMTAHLLFEEIDSELPTSLSEKAIKEILRGELGFEGIAITDALNMGALQNVFPPDEIPFRALEAGNNLLLYGDHRKAVLDHIIHTVIPSAFAFLKENITDVDAKVLRILQLKERLGQFPIAPREEILHSNDAKHLRKELYRRAVTLIGDWTFPQGKIGYIGKENTLKSFLQKNGIAFADPKEADTVIISITDPHEPLGIPEGKKCIFCLFCSPYHLAKFEGKGEAIFLGYENDPDSAEAVCDALLGKFHPTGKIPINR